MPNMRLAATGVFVMALAAMLPACVPQDVEDPGERAVVGAALGTALGTGLGATFAINPGIGAVIGAETGATLGALAGVMTSPPAPSYKPVAVPAEAVIPGFYDTWPPGYRAPPTNPETQSPHAG